MGNRRQHSCLFIQGFNRYTPIVDAQRRNSHNTAAALAAVSGILDVVTAALVLPCLYQGRQARITRSSSAVQFRHIQQPGNTAIAVVAFGMLFCLVILLLGCQPILIGLRHIGARHSTNSPHAQPRFSHKNSICCEKRHLCIVGY